MRRRVSSRMANLALHGGRTQRLEIVVQGYEQQAADNPDDANWLRCLVEVQQGSFRGRVDASLTTHDFVRLLSELDQVMAGDRSTATFDTMEEALAFSIELDRAGRAIVTGKLSETYPGGSQLSFTFESDLSFLAKTHADLKQLLAAFPVRD